MKQSSRDRSSTKRDRSSTKQARRALQARPRELVIECLTPTGAGMARDENRHSYFVRGVAPGDRIVALESPRERHMFDLVELLSAGPGRRDPSCVAQAACGGCDWMHIEPSVQQQAHRDNLVHLLGRFAPELPEIIVHPISEEREYRTRARLAVVSGPRNLTLGYRGRGSREVISIHACEVLRQPLFEAASTFSKLLLGTRGQGEISVALQTRQEGSSLAVIHLDYSADLPGEMIGKIDQAVKAGVYGGVSLAIVGSPTTISFGDPRPSMLTEDGKVLWFAAGGFAQASDHGARLLARRVAELADPAGCHVLELFSGSGTLSVALAREAESFIAVENDSAAVDVARENFKSRGLEGKLRVADAEQTVIPSRTDVVVLDPPRQGAPMATQSILKARPKRVVYVSCDMTTLARDVEQLVAGGYRIAALDICPLFPQTSHVETVCLLSRGSGPP